MACSMMLSQPLVFTASAVSAPAARKASLAAPTPAARMTVRAAAVPSASIMQSRGVQRLAAPAKRSASSLSMVCRALAEVRHAKPHPAFPGDGIPTLAHPAFQVYDTVALRPFCTERLERDPHRCPQLACRRRTTRSPAATRQSACLGRWLRRGRMGHECGGCGMLVQLQSTRCTLLARRSRPTCR
jgi:hypothetical protein